MKVVSLVYQEGNVPQWENLAILETLVPGGQTQKIKIIPHGVFLFSLIQEVMRCINITMNSEMDYQFDVSKIKKLKFRSKFSSILFGHFKNSN
jgi:hypothetical protein